jgi:hypothetical protein
MVLAPYFVQSGAALRGLEINISCYFLMNRGVLWIRQHP